MAQQGRDLLAVLAQVGEGLAACRRAGQQAVDAAAQLAGAEGLGEVAIGTGGDAFDAGFLARAGREHEDGHRLERLVFAQGLQEAEAVEPGHHHVGHHELGRRLAGERQGLGTVVRGDHLVLGLQQALHVVAQVGVVVGDQHACAFHAGRRRRESLRRRRIGQPAQRLLDVGMRVGRLGGGIGRAHHLLVRQVLVAEGQLHGEGGAVVELARDFDAAAVQLHELLHQCQADAGAFVAAATAVLQAVEALEHARERILGNAHAGVGHLQPQAVAQRVDRNHDLACERVLERVGEQVEHDLLPHVAVDPGPDGLGRHGHAQAEACALAGGAEAAREVGRQVGHVGLLVAGVDAAGLDAGEVEQGVHELVQPLAIALHDLQRLAHRRGRLRDRLFQGAEHQRERRAELMAHVAEELGLRAVELRQRFGAGALVLRCAGIGDGGADVVGHEFEEGAVAGIEWPLRAHRGDEDAGRALGGAAEGQQHHAARGLAVGAAGQGESARGGDLQRLLRAGHVGERPGALGLAGLDGLRQQARRQLEAGGGQPGAALVQQVHRGERHVVRVLGQHLHRLRAGAFHAAAFAPARAELAQRFQAAGPDHLLGGLGAGREHPFDPAAVDRQDGRVVEADVDLLARQPA